MGVVQAVWVAVVCLLMLQAPPVNSECQSCSGECKAENVDLTFVIDGSGSICEQQEVSVNCKNWINILEFVVNVVSFLNIGPDADRVAFVQYANQGRMEFKLTDYTDRSSLIAAIMNVQHWTGNTNTSGGLYVMRTQAFGASQGERNGTQNVAVVITDGLSTWDQARTLPEARLAHEAGIKVYAIGVTGLIDVNEVRRISSAPQAINLNYFIVPYFDQFGTKDFIETLHTSICKTYQIDNNLNKCPGTYTETGCYVVIETAKSWLGAQADCAQRAAAIGRSGMGELVSVSTQPLHEEISWLVQAMWTKRPTTSSMTDFWLGGHRDSRLFGGKDFSVWTWSNTTADVKVGAQGCFADQAGTPDLSYAMDFGASLSPDNCTSHCASRGYTVGGLRNAELCYCGNSYGIYGGSSQCSVQCSTSTSSQPVYCGGTSENNIYLVGGAYMEWAYDHPNNYDQNAGACGMMDGRWNHWQMGSDVCHKKNAYICELNTAIGSCFAGMRSGGAIRPVHSKCLYISQDFSGSGLKSWFDAQQACVTMGGQLLVVTADMHRQLKATLNDVGKSPFNNFWVGLLGKRWQWQSGAQFLYHAWSADQPTDQSENCLKTTYSTSTSSFTWASGACAQSLPSICRIDLTTPLESTTTTTTTAAVTTTVTPGNNTDTTDPSFGASTGSTGGLGIVEIVVIAILVGLVLVGLIVGIIACIFYKKGKKETTIVHPDKADYLMSNMLSPYNQYYENQDFKPSSGVTLSPSLVTRTETKGGEEHAFVSYNAGNTDTYSSNHYNTKRSHIYSEVAPNQSQQVLQVANLSQGPGSRRMISRDTSRMTVSLDGTRISMTE